MTKTTSTIRTSKSSGVVVDEYNDIKHFKNNVTNIHYFYENIFKLQTVFKICHWEIIVQIIHTLSASFCSATKLCLILIVPFLQLFAMHEFRIANYSTFLQYLHWPLKNSKAKIA